MTRDDLIRELVDKHGHISYKVMCNAAKHVSDVMVQALSTGSRIEIRGFGSFALRTRMPHVARNPKTGAVVQTAKKFVVHFKPGKELREKVDEAFCEV